MCRECNQFVCHPRCPNAPEPVAVYVCDCCGEDILEGFDVWIINDETFCEDCIRGFRKTAEVEDEAY